MDESDIEIEKKENEEQPLREPASSSETPLEDLSETNPWEDFCQLFLKPRLFFQQLERSDLKSSWIFLKAFLVFLGAFWLTLSFRPSLIQSVEAVLEDGNFKESLSQMSSLPVGAFLEQLDLQAIMDKVRVWSDWGVVVLPLLKIFDLLLLSTCTFVGFKIFKAKKPLSFSAIFLLSLYAHWALILGVIPGIGALLGFAFSVYYFLMGLSFLSRTHLLHAFAASFLMKFASSVFLGAALLLTGMLLLQAV